MDVSSVFPSGTEVRDAYTGATATVREDGLVYFVPGDGNVILVERAEDSQAQPAFTWDNATVYFLMTDRFKNGTTANDQGYPGRTNVDEGIGAWHGGDFVGLTQELDYIEALGANAVWISFPVEQIHGWVGGGGGDFQHFAYHGYWPLDFTKIDANYGTEAELAAFVDAAHARGIRVVLDVVLNHAGYASMQDLANFLPAVVDTAGLSWTPMGEQTWHSFNQEFIDFQSPSWRNWWGRDWIRSSTFVNHIAPGGDEKTSEVSFLPDFRTENPAFVNAPPFFANKPDTRVTDLPNARVRDYLVKWVTDWITEFGVDGFRVDTAKHVEFETWTLLKSEAQRKFDEWKANNADKVLDDNNFWMTGEVFPHGVERDAYFDNGFDSLINFDFQNVAARVVDDFGQLDGIYDQYADAINNDPTFNVLTYISSHDTYLFFHRNQEDAGLQNKVGTALLLLPGAVQIFYGDESGRPGWGRVSDPQQTTRSPMNWDSIDDGILEHWRKVGQFRKRHPAIGAGSHAVIDTDGPYVFSRQLGEDAVVVGIVAEQASE